MEMRWRKGKEEWEEEEDETDDDEDEDEEREEDEDAVVAPDDEATRKRVGNVYRGIQRAAGGELLDR